MTWPDPKKIYITRFVNVISLRWHMGMYGRAEGGGGGGGGKGGEGGGGKGAGGDVI